MTTNKTNKPSHIVIIEDEELIRAAFILLLQRFKNIAELRSATNGHDGLKLIAQNPPELVLMDIKMPVMDGIETTKRIKSEYPRVKVLGLTAEDNSSRLIAALEAGMDGIILKKASPAELKDAMTAVLTGQRYLSPAIGSMFAAFFPNREQQRGMLTPREKEIIAMMATGMRAKEVANQLQLSPRTVEKHCENARRKLGFASTTEMLIKWAQQPQ
jgi:DNA-binding NarL/FixJ family response regulator